MNGYLGECVKQYIRDFHSIQSHRAADGGAILADVYALVYLHMRINDVLDRCNGLHTNA